MAAGPDQFLLIRVNDARLATEAEYSILVQPPEANSLPLNPLREGGRCASTWLYKLPTAGTYRVTFAPKGVSHGLDITVLASRNAILDSGIKAEQIAIDFRGFAQKSQMHLAPYKSGDACDIDDLQAPAHWVVENGGFELRIMPLAGLKLLSLPDDPIYNLEDAVRRNQTVADAQKLPYPSRDDSASVMTARQELLVGNGWRGLRWIGGYAQDGDYPVGLGYVFQGISDDGQFFILVRASISHAQQQRDVAELEKANSNNAATETRMRLLLEKTLTVAAPDSFRPNLGELDAVVRSLEFRQ